MTEPAATTARVERVLEAAPDEVYALWVDEEALATFIAPPPGRAEVEIDPRPGGRLRIVMTFPERRVEIEGAFLALDRPNRISFSWTSDPAEYESVVTVTLEPHGDGRTLMTIAHTRLPSTSVASYLHGWGAIADAVAALAAR